MFAQLRDRFVLFCCCCCQKTQESTHNLLEYNGIREPSEVFYLGFCSGLYLLLFF